MRYQRAPIGGPELLACLRTFVYFIAAACLALCGGLQQASASTATALALVVTSRESAATTVTSGRVVTLTATVTAAGTAVTSGQVNFCEATAKYCTDFHILGTAQLTGNGTATLKFRPESGAIATAHHLRGSVVSRYGQRLYQLKIEDLKEVAPGSSRGRPAVWLCILDRSPTCKVYLFHPAPALESLDSS